MTVRQADIEAYLEAFRGREVHIDTILKDNGLDNGQKANLRVLLCGRLREKRLTKPSGKRDGWIKVLRDIKPIKVGDVDAAETYQLKFPRSYKDDTSFGLENLFVLSPGDQIVIAGSSNAGKSLFVINILGENVLDVDCVLMGNEYANNDGFIMPRFYRRLKRMGWAPLFDEAGELTFELLPIHSDYEDYVQPGKLTMIDWISLRKDFYEITGLLEDIKRAAGRGVVITVLQKKADTPWGEGGERTERFADVYITIDKMGRHESRLTLGRVKEPKGKVMGMMWGFETNDGANIFNIREIVTCKKCHGRGTNFGNLCDPCIGKGYIDKEEF